MRKNKEFINPRKERKTNEQNIKPSSSAKAIYSVVEKYSVNENILFITPVKREQHWWKLFICHASVLTGGEMFTDFSQKMPAPLCLFCYELLVINRLSTTPLKLPWLVSMSITQFPSFKDPDSHCKKKKKKKKTALFTCLYAGLWLPALLKWFFEYNLQILFCFLLQKHIRGNGILQKLMLMYTVGSSW